MPGSSMKPTKPLTIRLAADQADDLELVARVQNQAISDVIRSAISDRIEQAKKDPSFQDGLRDRIERAQRLLGRR
jgi:predicted transcriptional regulator